MTVDDCVHVAYRAGVHDGALRYEVLPRLIDEAAELRALRLYYACRGESDDWRRLGLYRDESNVRLAIRVVRFRLRTVGNGHDNDGSN